MADETKKVLIGLGLKTEDWQASVAKLRSTLRDQDTQDAAREKASASATQRALVDAKKLTTEQRVLGAENVKILDAMRQQLARDILVSKELERQIALEKQKTEEIKKQSLLQRAMSSIKGAFAGATPGGGTQIAKTALSSVAGSGLLGSVASGFAFGGGAGLVNAAVQGIQGLTQEIRKFVDESGPIQQQMELFIRLSGRAGKSAEEWKEEMQKATKGLVDDDLLISQSNKILSQNTGISADQITKMFEVTTKLARAQGKEAAPAIQQVSAALLRGRFQMLPYTLGLEKTTVAELRRAEKLPQHIRLQEQFNIVVAAAERQIKAMGEPAITFTDRMKQMHIAQDDFFKALTVNLTKSSGFQRILELIDGYIATLAKDGAKLAEVLGDLLGDALGVLADTGNVALQTLKAIWEMFGVLGEVMRTLAEIYNATLGKMFGSIATEGGTATMILGLIRSALLTTSQLLTTAAAQAQRVALTFRLVKDMMAAAWSKDTAKAAYDRFKTDLDKVEQDMWDRIAKLQDIKEGKKVAGVSPGVAPKAEDKVDQEYEDKKTKADLEIAKARLDRNVELEKQALAQKRELLEDYFKDGKMLLTDYVSEVQVINNQELAIEERRIRTERDIKLKELKLGNEDEEMAGRQSQVIRIQAEAQLDKVREQFRLKNKQDVAKADDDEKAAKLAVLNNEHQDVVEAQKKERAELEKKFKGLEIPARTYLNLRKQMAEEERNVALQFENDKFESTEKTEKNKVELIKATTDILQKYNEDVRAVDEETAKVILKDLKDRYDREKELINVRMQDPASNKNELTRELIELTDKYLDQLKFEPIVTKHGTEEWYTKRKQIQEAKNDVKNFSKELQDMYDASRRLTDALGAAFGKFGKTSGVGEAFQTGSNILGNISAYAKGVGQRYTGEAAINVGAGAKTALSNLFDKSSESLSTFSDKVQDVADVLGEAANQISTIVSSFTKPTSGVGGAVSGAFGGQGAAKFLSGLTGIASIGGPIGQAIGAGVGAIFGGILGHARKETEKASLALQKSFTKITDAFSAGTTKLKDAITELEQVRTNAVSQLSGSKSGRAELKNLLPDFDKQIAALKKQQTDLRLAMQEEIKYMSAPKAMQDHIKSLDDLIKKYKEYAGALGDTGEALNWLHLSLQKYVQEQQSELRTAEQGAIDNAIQLNDLLKQRQDIMSQAAKQEYDVLAAGNITRQRTRAQTTYDEISQIRKDRDAALQQVNQQIELAQFRYDKEQAIFGLATDRIALEKELVVLQKENIAQDITRIVALKSVIELVQGGGTDMGTLVAALNKVTGLNDQFANTYDQHGRYGMEVYGELT